MAGFIDILRSGNWLTRERVRLVAFALLAAFVIGAGFLIATSNGLNDRFGRPLGTDFSNVYAAGTYVLDGEPAAPFDPAKQFAREQAIFGQATQFYGWHYPAVLSRSRRPAGGDALLARFDRLAGRDAGALSPVDARDRFGRLAREDRKRPPLAPARRSPSLRYSSISGRVITAFSPPR